jgi:hypothetical protein
MNIPIKLTSGLLVCLIIPLGLAAAPRNDNLNSATTIKTLPYSQQQDTADATNEANEAVPLCSNEAKNSVWYQYKPKNNQDVVFDTIGSNYDTTISIWQGNKHPLTYVACNDDNSGTPQSQVRVELNRGETYYINISGYVGEVGMLSLNAIVVNKLTNDNQADAKKITPDKELFYSYTQTVKDASIAADETVASCASEDISATVWYQYTPKSDQRVAFNTLGSDYNTVLSVWSGEQPPLTELACNDDNAMPQSQLAVALESGKTYYISVATIEPTSPFLPDPTGLLVFNMTPPPENDDRLNAIEIIEPFPYTNVQYTGGATLEPEEVIPGCSPEAAASVWYLFTPTTDYDGITFSTATSGYDTVLSIWQATDDSALIELGCNDNSLATEQSSTSQVTIPVTNNVNYYVDISGMNGETGNLVFQVDESPGRDFNILQQPQDQSIASNQTATLTVELSDLDGQLIVDGGTVQDQWEVFVALPIDYQWYQGQSGDISTPVGTNSHIFTTPPLTATTPYWVRITNPTGRVDSEMAKVIVDGNDTIPSTTNGVGIDPQYNDIPTTANFSGQITSLDTGLSGNDMEIQQPEIISVESVVDVDPNHLGQTVEVVMVGVYTNSVAQNAYMRNGDNWEIWDWNIANLAAAEPAETLTAQLNVAVFDGSLAGLPGHFTGYVGYRLQNGDIFYSGKKPMTLVVE